MECENESHIGESLHIVLLILDACKLVCDHESGERIFIWSLGSFEFYLVGFDDVFYVQGRLISKKSKRKTRDKAVEYRWF